MDICSWRKRTDIFRKMSRWLLLKIIRTGKICNLFIIFQEGPFISRTDMDFPGGSIYVLRTDKIFQEDLSKRHEFSRRVYICSSNRHKYSRRANRKDMFFQGGSICSSNRPYYFIKHILIFPETL